MAKAYEDIGQLKLSYDFYVRANKLKKQLNKYTISTDIKLFEKVKSKQIEINRDLFLVNLPSPEVTPIFIVGMPRSGTTLVEQIISQHSQVEVW